jgi:hypothetical protein
MDQVTLTAHGQQKMRAVPAAPRRYDGQNGNPVYDHQQGGHYGMFSMQCFLVRHTAGHNVACSSLESPGASLAR